MTPIAVYLNLHPESKQKLTIFTSLNIRNVRNMSLFIGLKS